MAAGVPCGLVSLNHVVVPNHHANETDQKQTKVMTEGDGNGKGKIDYVQRGQWLRAAVLGAIDGLVSVTSLMVGVGAVKRDVKAMLLAGFAGSVAGACGMAIGEFVSVCTQQEVEVGQIMRDVIEEMRNDDDGDGYEKDVETMGSEKKRRTLPNPFQAALASALSYSVGAVIPLLSAAFLTDYKIRFAVVVVTASLALLCFGYLGAVLGRTPKVRSSQRILLGGWLAMSITFGLTKLLALSGYSGFEE